VGPWIALAGAAAVLEAIALLLGGRSLAFPTISTVIDHALRYRPARAAMFVAWLALGVGLCTLRGVRAER
jgi:hypothetical protein